jgi:peptidoglycan/LPS O-acetylase OafA/YrhL
MSNSKTAKPRIYYIDNLRIFLIALVVLHHLAITYGAPGGWFYNESAAEFPEIIPLSMFVAANQAFFMGMFFFVSAYFILPSLNKKGFSIFIKDRLIRLGLPMLIFFFFLFPLTIYMRNNYILDDQVSLQYLIFKEKEFGFGPMWFVEALLLFTFLFLIWKKFVQFNTPKFLHKLPSAGGLLLFALLIGLGQFIIRIWFPVGWAMPFMEFQLPHFLQYIFLFAFGIVAYQHNWLDEIKPGKGWRWFIFVQILIFVGFPIIFILGGAIENGVEPFMGGMNWKSFSYAIWEQLVGFSLIMALFGIFKFRFNNQGKAAKRLSAGAYAVYVLHTPILIAMSALALGLEIPQFWKFVVLAPVALLVCFSVANLVKRIPVIKDIF